MRRALALLVVMSHSGVAWGHELTPALLLLVERGGGTYEVAWRVPRDEAPRGAIRPVLPPEAQELQGRVVDSDSQAWTERWVVRLAGGVEGKAFRLQGPPGARTDALIRIALRDGRVVHGRLSPDGTPFVVPARAGWRMVAATYLRLGVEHILLGFDHLLFVLGLLLLTGRRPRALLATITSFTAAHSVTLALATLGVLRVPGPPVEATIALSILFVAREALRPAGSLAAAHPWAVALPFGLLHGLGFAGALAGVGVPAGEIPWALGAFNVGVELGQLAFVAVVLLPLRLADGPRVRLALAYGIGVFAAALCVSRVLAFG
jgi:hypothetical protein